MRSWGIFLIIMAVGSVILPYLGLQFLVVAWIDMWGPTIGWLIRGGLAVIGVGMIVAGGRTGGGSGTPPGGR